MGRGRLAAFIVGAATIAVATFACRQLVGIGNDPPQGAPSSTDSGAPSTDAGADSGFTYGQGACETCVTTMCSAQSTACSVNPSCNALEGCMSGCGTDPTCRAQCGVTNGLGNDGATPGFEACLASSCSAECGLTCGGLAAVFPPASPFGNAAACESCIAMGSECAAVTACAIDPGCQAALRCQFSSDTIDVWEACPGLPGQDVGAGLGFYEENAPIASSCSAECSWGADWSCVGKVNWPPATQGALDVNVFLYDVLTQTPIAGATVTLCNTGAPACGGGLGSVVTNDAGTATIMRPSVTSPLLGYLDISSPTIVPLLAFDVFPISEPRFTFSIATLPPSDVALLAASLGVTLDPSLGAVFVLAVDCRIGLAPGVQFSLAPAGPSTVGPFYYVGGAYSVDAGATDTSGVAAFFNVPVSPAMLELTVTPQALGRASGKMTLFARDGGESELVAVPTPTP
jgi:hypothetical protein